MIGYRVLVVDDDRDAAEVLRQYLELWGYAVRVAHDGATGLQTLLAEGADIVLLDIDMPGKDGFQTLAEIRANPLLAQMPALFLSHFDRPNLKVKGLEMGADDYITKPFDRAELQARIRAALRRSERFRRIVSSLEGDLGDVTLPVLLQTLAMGDKSARVVFDDPPGEVRVVRGRFSGAAMAGHSGEEALLRMLLVARGKFKIAFEPAEPDGSGPRIDDLLLRLSSRLDEVLDVLRGGPMLEEPAVLKDDQLRYPRFCGEVAGAVSLRVVLVGCPAPLEQGARAAAEAWRRASVPSGGHKEAA